MTDTDYTCGWCHAWTVAEGNSKPAVALATHERHCTANPDRVHNLDDKALEWEQQVKRGQLVPIEELAPYQVNRDRMEEVLLALAVYGPFLDAAGRARQHGLGSALPHFSPDNLRTATDRLEQGGWIMMKKTPRQVYEVRLTGTAFMAVHAKYGERAERQVRVTHIGMEVVPPEPEQPTGGWMQSFDGDWCPVCGGDLMVCGHRPPEQPLALDEPAGNGNHDAEAEELGRTRPGRVVSRIERLEAQLPQLIEAGVAQGLAAAVAQLLQGAGWYQGPAPEAQEATQEALEAAQQEAALAQTHLLDAQASLAESEALREWLVEQEDARLRRVNDGQVASKKSINAHQLPDTHRDLGRRALEAGWSILPTRGSGHYAWRSPDGKHVHYTPSTPSDWRAIRNDTAALERLGLPKL